MQIQCRARERVQCRVLLQVVLHVLYSVSGCMPKPQPNQHPSAPAQQAHLLAPADGRGGVEGVRAVMAAHGHGAVGGVVEEVGDLAMVGGGRMARGRARG